MSQNWRWLTLNLCIEKWAALDDKVLSAADIETVSGGKLRVDDLELARRESAALARTAVTSIMMQAVRGYE